MNALLPQTASTAPQANALPANALDLKDIHVPEQISNFPVAYGWWLLGALIVFIIVFAIIKIKKSAKQNQVKKQVLARLKSNTEMTSNDTIALLKWAAIHYFSREELAKLFGDSLKEFLISKLPIKHQQRFADLSEQAFLNQYHANSSTQSDDALHQAATLWLTHALPPKPLKKLSKAANENNNLNQGVSA